MRGCRQLSALYLVLGTTVILAQPPKAAPGNSPRPLPELPATALPEKSAPVVETKAAPALIKVKVPENATVWFEHQKMTQGGAMRVFQSPGLEGKKTFYYKVKVSWPTGVGTLTKDFVTEQEVAVRGGETTSVDFTPLVTHSKQQKPTSTADMIRQAAHNTPAPAAKSPRKTKNDD